MKHILLFLMLLIVFAALAAPAFADDPITITSVKFVSNFRRNLLFQLEAQSSARITQVTLTIQIDGQPSSIRQVPEFTPDKKIQATYEWNLVQKYLPPGVAGKFWWTIEDEAGNKKQTDPKSFRVEDTSQSWKKLSNDQLALHWYAGGDSFGKALFDRGVEAMKYLQQDTGVTVDTQIQIFIYGNRNDFRNALEAGSTEWTGGRTFPDYGVILIHIETTSLEWGKGAMVHELTHQVIHQKIRGPLGDLSMPVWLAEGLAMYYETFPGALDPEFATPLRRAIQSDTLLPLRTLNSAFATDESTAFLSYAQSYSVVDFVIRHYGREKLAQLLQECKKGGVYDDILKTVLGVDTDALEVEWRKDVGAKPRAIVTRLAQTPTAFPTFSLSTDTTPVPIGAKPTATRQPVAAVATPAPLAPTPAPRAPSNLFTQLCGGSFGVMAIALAGLVWSRRMRKAQV